jgi:hypothetical protein
VNADGLQLYLGAPDADDWGAAWLVVPERDSEQWRITPLVAPATADTLQGSWRHTPTGWWGRLVVPAARLRPLVTADGVLRVDLIVNERPPDRLRRRGQLILSGSDGEFVYLRGDRHEPSRALLVRWSEPERSISTSARSA